MSGEAKAPRDMNRRCVLGVALLLSLSSSCWAGGPLAVDDVPKPSNQRYCGNGICGVCVLYCDIPTPSPTPTANPPPTPTASPPIPTASPPPTSTATPPPTPNPTPRLTQTPSINPIQPPAIAGPTTVRGISPFIGGTQRSWLNDIKDPTLDVLKEQTVERAIDKLAEPAAAALRSAGFFVRNGAGQYVAAESVAEAFSGPATMALIFYFNREYFVTPERPDYSWTKLPMTISADPSPSPPPSSTISPAPYPAPSTLKAPSSPTSPIPSPGKF